MFDVTLKSSPSLQNSYLVHQHDVPVSLAAVYQKLNNLEPNIAAELVCYSAKRLQPVLTTLHSEKPLFVDGNHFSGTQHRLKGTRTQ